MAAQMDNADGVFDFGVFKIYPLLTS